MKVLKYFTSLLLLIMASSCYANKDVKYAWWVDLNIEPKVAKLNGLTADYLDRNWDYASLVGYSDIKALVSESDYQQLLNSGFSFAKVIDLDGNEKAEAIRVGVYKTKDNKKGIFLAVFEEGNLMDVLADGTAHGFSVLTSKGKEIRWYRCIECNDYSVLKWNGSGYVLE